MLKIIGLGNHLRGDDAIGLRVLQELRDIKLAAEVQLIEAGADAFSILEHLIDKEPVLIIDCALLGKEPGAFIKFDVTKAGLNKELQGISLHGFSFAEVYAMAKKIGPVAPCSVIAIQPKSVEFNKPLSVEVEKNIPLIIEIIEKETLRYAFSENTYY